MILLHRKFQVLGLCSENPQQFLSIYKYKEIELLINIIGQKII